MGEDRSIQVKGRKGAPGGLPVFPWGSGSKFGVRRVGVLRKSVKAESRQ